jgi:hypothetical protein
MRFKMFSKMICIGVVLLGCAADVGAQETVSARVPLDVLSLNGDYYLSSTGGPTANGCEAWATISHSGNYIYVALCDAPRLESLGLNISEALVHNDGLETQRRVTLQTDYYMIDFVDVGYQSLLGETANNAIAYVILDSGKELRYYRAEGNYEQLDALGFDVAALVEANGKLDPERRIVLHGDYYNLAERLEDRAQMLIGETANGELAAIVLDAEGKLIEIATE